MKKIILLMLITLSYEGFSQITLESQINTPNPHPDARFITTDNIGVKYVLDNLFYNGTVVIYNIDHTIHNTINVDINSLYDTTEYNNPDINLTAMTQHLFDNDDGIEFFIEIDGMNVSGTNYLIRSAIIDDDGSIIQIFDNLRAPNGALDYFMPTSRMIINTSNGFKMILISDNKVNIYSLPGSVSSIINNNRNSNLINAYPNPTHNSINILYKLPQYCKSAELYLYNSASKQVGKYKIFNNSNKFNIKTDKLASGIYYYRIIGNNYESKTKKFIRIN